ncbi:MAG: hypothetical protein ACRD03_12685 [Acidimicrobiales bacterium]
MPDARLRWEGRASPRAAFCGVEGDLAEAVAAALPTVAALDRLAIARHRSGSAELARSVSRKGYHERAEVARANPGDWSLAATVTDLVPGDEIAHGPFDPPVPKGLTMYQRVRACRERLPSDHVELVAAVSLTLTGRGRRVQANGLGFDVTRSSAGVDASAEVMVDPVIECLAFEGLQLFSMRGDGERKGGRQRGFASSASRRGAFRWPAWRQPLDLWGVDALLDQVANALPRDGSVAAGATGRLRRLGVTALYGSVYQRPRGSADTYRAFGAERLL